LAEIGGCKGRALGSWWLLCRFWADLSREKLKIKKEERRKGNAPAGRRTLRVPWGGGQRGICACFKKAGKAL